MIKNHNEYFSVIDELITDNDDEQLKENLKDLREFVERKRSHSYILKSRLESLIKFTTPFE